MEHIVLDFHKSPKMSYIRHKIEFIVYVEVKYFYFACNYTLVYIHILLFHKIKKVFYYSKL